MPRTPQPVDVKFGASESPTIHLVCESSPQFIVEGEKRLTAILERPLQTVSACVAAVCVEDRVTFVSWAASTHDISCDRAAQVALCATGGESTCLDDSPKSSPATKPKRLHDITGWNCRSNGIRLSTGELIHVKAALGQLAEHIASLQANPPIKPGTKDPYEPPK